MYVNVVTTYQLKAKDSEIKRNLLSLGYILKDFTVDNMKKYGLNEFVYNLSVAYKTVDVSDIVDIHNYLMEKYNRK